MVLKSYTARRFVREWVGKVTNALTMCMHDIDVSFMLVDLFAMLSPSIHRHCVRKRVCAQAGGYGDYYMQ